jgi:putative membrane protein
MEARSRSFAMKMKHMCGVVIAAAVLMLASTVGAQTDPNATTGPGGSPFPQAASSQGSQSGSQANGTQAGQPSSMRDSLGAPGQVGQQILDKQFVRAAAEDGLADVKLGTLAVEKGGPEVKEVAQKMVDDHTAMNKEMDTVADALGVSLPKKVNKEVQAEYEKLSGLSGKDFDTEYLTFIVKAHWQNLHAFYMEASVAADPDLQSQVVKDMGTMHEHLGVIAKAAKAEGITLPPRPPRQAPATAASK